MEKPIDDLDSVLKEIKNPDSIRILESISQRPATYGNLSRQLGLTSDVHGRGTMYEASEPLSIYKLVDFRALSEKERSTDESSALQLMLTITKQGKEFLRAYGDQKAAISSLSSQSPESQITPAHQLQQP